MNTTDRLIHLHGIAENLARIAKGLLPNENIKPRAEWSVTTLQDELTISDLLKEADLWTDENKCPYHKQEYHIELDGTCYCAACDHELAMKLQEIDDATLPDS